MSSITSLRRFMFENASSIKYDVLLRRDGSGYARRIDKGDAPHYSLAKIALTVDVGKRSLVASAHVSRLWHEPMYNTGQRLASVLNATS